MTIKKQVKVHFIVVLGYILFITANYWTLLSGNNIMKWDIIEAEYPLQVMMSDAISNGCLPLWNPLMNMGMPYYSVVGMPVWYPITLIMACFGYTPWTISLEYTIHLLLAAYGMFLLTDSVLKAKKGTTVISFMMGLIYCSSGLFLSNAEHIMFIVSAAWLPYVFYYVKQYLEKKKLIFLLMGALSAGFIITGGYPEMFYDLFLILVPYFLYIAWDRNKTTWRNVLTAARKYALLCICTLASSAIALLPFVHVMSYITRTANAEQPVTVVPFINLLSIFFPKAGFYLNNCEISMCNYYTSIFALISIPCLSKENLKNRWGFLGIAIFSFLMSWGEYSPFYMFCHKYLPMYATFRFPTVFRPFVTIFFLLVLSDGLLDMLHGKVNKYSIFFAGGLTLCGIWGIWVFNRYENGRISVPFWDTALQGNIFNESLKEILIISICYIVLLLLLYIKCLKLFKRVIIMLLAVMLELSIFIQDELPITIATYDTLAVKSDSTIKNEVQKWYTENEKRNRNGNFSGNSRSTTKNLSNTKQIVFNKSFDEEGYLSIKLEATEQYKQSYNRSIIESNPIAYFTNNIVSSSQIALEDWRKLGSIPRTQIHVDHLHEGISLALKENINLIPKVLAGIEGNSSIDGNTIYFEGNILADGTMGRCITIWLESVEAKTCNVNACFEDITGTLIEYADAYTIQRNDEKPYIELFFPDSKQDYNKISVNIQQVRPIQIDVEYTERMNKDDYVTVDYFDHNNISMTVQAPSDGYIVLLQSNYPGWNAYVDGDKSTIQTVDGCFIGLPIKQGKHQLILEFRPVDFFVGAGITGTFLIFLLFLAIKDFINYNKNILSNVANTFNKGNDNFSLI